ncbi:Uncharacterised protein [Vibrio cholerae]|nr:Uncharacterised protein [Vibrio cholerae]
MIISKPTPCGAPSPAACATEIKLIEKRPLSYCCLMLILLGCTGVNSSGLPRKSNPVHEIRLCLFVVVALRGYDARRTRLQIGQNGLHQSLYECFPSSVGSNAGYG